MHKFSLLIFFLFTLAGAMAQANQACPCCTDNHHLFDFWLGDWVVSDTSGTVVGKNNIFKVENGCVISENWTGGKGTTGRSFNYYNPSDSTWNQLWLDGNGTILNLKGKGQPGKMVLKSDLKTNANNQKFYHQIAWTKQEDGSVTQNWTIHDPTGKKLRDLFYGIYRLRDPSSK